MAAVGTRARWGRSADGSGRLMAGPEPPEELVLIRLASSLPSILLPKASPKDFTRILTKEHCCHQEVHRYKLQTTRLLCCFPLCAALKCLLNVSSSHCRSSPFLVLKSLKCSPEFIRSRRSAAWRRAAAAAVARSLMRQRLFAEGKCQSGPR